MMFSNIFDNVLERTPFIAERVNPNEIELYPVHIFTINLIWKVYINWGQCFFSSLMKDDFYENEELLNFDTDKIFESIEEFNENNEKLDRTRYRTMNVWSWLVNEFIRLKEKFKWFTNIKHIVMHSHNFNKNLKHIIHAFENIEALLSYLMDMKKPGGSIN